MIGVQKITKKIIKKVARLAVYESKGYIPVKGSGFWKFRRDPKKSLKKTANEFEKIEGKNIIEIGTGVHGGMSGNSMLEWEHTSANRIIAVDVEKERLKEVKKYTHNKTAVELELQDGLKYLEEFEEKIHLLYLDFWAKSEEEEIPGVERSKAYGEAYKNAKNKLDNRSLILIDDTDHVNPWKQTRIVPMARKDGYKVLHTGRQTLLKR